MKVLVLYHTVYGHTLQLARAVEEGVKSVAGIEAIFRRAPEFPHVEKELEAKDGYETKIWREQKGGQETTCITMMIPLIHLGMLIVGVPYSTQGMIHTEARGGTPYGASTISGPKGELAPTPEDLAICRVQGKRVAELTKKVRG
jgi:multimeric flavodoxin WrbA